MEARRSEEQVSGKWAPWWLYVAVILGTNYLRQLVVPKGSIPEWAVVLLVLGLSAVLFLAITVAYRVAQRGAEWQGGN